MVCCRDFLYVQVIAVLLSAPKCHYERFELISYWLISKENSEHREPVDSASPIALKDHNQLMPSPWPVICVYRFSAPNFYESQELYASWNEGLGKGSKRQIISYGSNESCLSA